MSLENIFHFLNIIKNFQRQEINFRGLEDTSGTRMTQLSSSLDRHLILKMQTTHPVSAMKLHPELLSVTIVKFSSTPYTSPKKWHGFQKVNMHV